MNMKELEALVVKQGEHLQAAQEAHMHLVQRADNIVEGFKQELATRDERADNIVEGFKQELATRDERADNIVEGFKQELATRDERVKELTLEISRTQEAQHLRANDLDDTTAKVSEMRDHQDGMNDTIAGLQTQLEHSRAVINEQAQVIVQVVNFFESWPTISTSIETLGTEVSEYINRIETLETLVLARNASAATKRNMTDEDALRVLTGDLKGLSHKEAAEQAGLTYAQVYSCRLEFTFKHVHKAMRDAATSEAPWKNLWAK